MNKMSQIIGGSLLSAGIAYAQETPPQPNARDLVHALQGVFGKHPNTRASHAKGVCVAGYFEPDAAAKTISSADFLSAKNIPLLGRFSVGGGSPTASDKAKTVRGLAFRLGAPDDPILDLVLISAPVFMVATPTEFVGFMDARKPDPATGKPDPAKVQAFNLAHPSTKAQIDFLTQSPVPASYAQAPYFGVNAFRFTNAQMHTVHGRWRVEPVAGRKGLDPAALEALGDHFLSAELETRLAAAPVAFDLIVQIANEGDNVINPTVAWPATRQEVRFGRIYIQTTQASCGDVMFNPAQLPAGIALSDDPTLRVRSGAYAVSHAQRLSR
jgi:catalase